MLHHTADVHSVTLFDLGWQPTAVIQDDDATLLCAQTNVKSTVTTRMTEMGLKSVKFISQFGLCEFNKQDVEV